MGIWVSSFGLGFVCFRSVLGFGPTQLGLRILDNASHFSNIFAPVLDLFYVVVNLPLIELDLSIFLGTFLSVLQLGHFKGAMGDADEVQPLVCDNGSGMVKVNDYPHLYFLY